ncbi:MAG: LysR family transcriptional regulator [Alcaligenaceae bacterium]|nr:LysR family transcriptional regulator [Alcaligenaceae bacterium]
MRAFLMVHQSGSFTKAAEQLHITQAGLSALIKELETQLGSRLFERTTRRVSLTPQGLIFLPIVQHMDQQLDSVVRTISDYEHQAQRTLRIAASPVMVNGILPLVLKRHASHHPDDIIELLDVARQDVLPEVEQGNADLGMGLFLRQVSGLKFFRIFSTALMLVSPMCLRTH